MGKDLSKLVKKVIINTRGHKQTVYVKPTQMQAQKDSKNPNWEQTRNELEEMGVSFYGENVLKDKYALERLENTLKSFNVVDFFDKHMEILEDVSFQTSEELEYNLNVSRIGEGLLQVNIENEDISLIRNIEVKWKRAEHESFHMDEYLQGKNIGKKILKAEFEAYQKAGIEKVELHANSQVGGYAWARYGFKADVDFVEQNLHIVLDNWNPRDFPNEDKQKIFEVIKRWRKENPNDNLFPVNLVATLKNDQGIEIGRTAMVNANYPAEFDLTNKDQVNQFYKYVA